MSYNRDSIWDQLLRIPLTEHVKRTIAYHTQDRVRPMGPGVVAAASPKPHTLHVFDDDRDIIDSSAVDPAPQGPLPLSERDPDYYPGGNFVDEIKNVTDPEEGFQGGFGDVMVKLPAPVTGEVSRVGERNFQGFADDVNQDLGAERRVHPRAHSGDEFDAGGALADVVRRPETVVHPMDDDRFVSVPAPVAGRPRPQPKAALELGDDDVPLAKAELPEDDAALKVLGLGDSPSEVRSPVKAEVQYRYGLMFRFHMKVK